MCAAFCNTVGTTANSQPATSRPAISGVWWTCLLTIWTRSGVCPRPSASSWGIAAGLHIHVAVVGQGQGLLRRRRRLSGFGRLTEKKKKNNRQERKADRVSDFAAQSSSTWFQPLQRIPLSDTSSTQQTKYCEEYNSYLTRCFSGMGGKQVVRNLLFAFSVFSLFSSKTCVTYNWGFLFSGKIALWGIS